MTKKLFYFALIVCSHFLSLAQEKTCDTNQDEPLLDLNSITKCTVEETSEPSALNKKQVNIQVTARKRVVRKRESVTGLSGNTNARKVASLKEKASMIGALDLSKEEVIENVPFSLVEEIPLFKSCEKAAFYEQEKCFKEEISKHIVRNFQYPESAYDDNIQGRVYAQFVIDRTGTVTNLSLRGPYKGELLEKEAARIINKLPKFIPGKHHGKAVKVKYGIPISFKIPGKKPSNIKKKIIKAAPVKSSVETVSFNAVEVIPNFSKCTGDNTVDCFNAKLMNYVNGNLYYPTEAYEKRIQGKIYTKFVIDTQGNVINVQAKGPQGCEILEEAAVKLFQGLPKFSPGKRNGKLVNVEHTFPLDFKLQ